MKKSGLRNFGLHVSVSALAMAFVSTAVMGQEIETVVSTGSRAAVAGALELRKNATQQIDSIVSEDIGKLPDSTVVESLQHVTGVAIIRNNVEPAVVLIRGLPDVQTLMNGRAIFTSTGRSVQLPDFPSELLSRVDVHKASSATDIEGGIAGLIDIRLHRPFDFAGYRFAFLGKAVNPSLAGNIDPQVGLLISDRWNTEIGEVGVLLDVAFKSIHNRQDQILEGQRTTIIGPVPGAGTTGGSVCTMNPITNCPVRTTPANNPIGAGGLNVGFAAGVRPGYAAESSNISLFQRSGTIERSSVNLASQWRPFPGLDIFAEAFYSRLRQQAPSFVDVKLRSNCPDAAASTVFSGTNIVATGKSGCYSLTSIQDRRNKEDTAQIAAGADWQVTDNFLFSTEVDVTQSKVLSVNLIPDTAYNYPFDGFSFDNNFEASGGAFVSTVGNPQASASNLILDQLFDQRTKSQGGDWQWRADWTYSFGPGSYLKSVAVGFRAGARSARNSGPSNAALNCTQAPNPTLAYNKYIVATLASPVCQAFLAQSSGGNGQPANYTTLGGITVASLGAPASKVTHGNFFGGRFGETSWVTMDPDWLYENTERLRNLYGYSGPQDDVPSSTFVVNEFTQSGYVKAEWGFDVWGVPVDGNFGGRVVVTDLTEQAFLTNQNAGQISFTPTTARKRTYDFLPSFNMRAELMEGLFFRLGASKTVTRPTFAQLNPAQSFSGAGQTLLGQSASGNPNLNPIRSVNLDLDGSYYWGLGNHLNMSLFHREVKGYIQNSACTPATVPGCSASGQISVNGLVYNYSLPLNLQDAVIEGAEAGYSQFLDFLPGFWSGFGWDVNATYVDSIFNNVTKWHANFAGIYEQGPYSFRVSYTWSSSYKINPTYTPGVQPQELWARPRENLDASFNYTWDDNLILTAEMTNIINSQFKTHAGRPGSTNFLLYNVEISQFDKTISLGLRYKL